MTQIVMAADAEYAHHVPCLIAQVAVHAPTAEGVVLLLDATTDTESERLICAAADNAQVSIDVRTTSVLAEMAAAGAIASRGHVSPFTYSKLLLPEVLVDLDQILYLDVDVLIRADISALVDWQLHHPLGAVPELGGNGRHIHGNTRTPYFNAGVLRMSLDRLREEGLWQRSQQILAARPRLTYQDQDVLNICFHDRFDTLPATFNVFDSMATAAHQSMHVLTDPALVHFTGPVKPWHDAGLSPFATEWRTVEAARLGLSDEAATVYVFGTPAPSASLALERARHSVSGQRMRRALPLEVKRGLRMVSDRLPVAPTPRLPLPRGDRPRITAVNRVLALREVPYLGPALVSIPTQWRYPVQAAVWNWALAPGRKSRAKDTLSARRAAAERAAAQLAAVQEAIESRVEVAVHVPVEPAVAVADEVPVEEVVKVPAVIESAIPVDAQVTPTSRPTVATPTSSNLHQLSLLVSAPRSGTKAVGSLLARGISGVHFAGEAYLGFFDRRDAAVLYSRFPWLEDAVNDQANERDVTEKRRLSAQISQRISDDPIGFTDAIVSAHSGAVLIKLFASHLTNDALAVVLEHYRPPLLVLRRTNLFTFISWLKALESNEWNYSDSTDVPTGFSAESAQRFITVSDGWHYRIAALAHTLDLPVTHVTYDGVFETRTDLKILREFYSDHALRRAARDDDSWVANTVIQDRRSDSSLAHSFHQFAALPADLQRNLLRLPGTNAWGH